MNQSIDIAICQKRSHIITAIIKQTQMYFALATHSQAITTIAELWGIRLNQPNATDIIGMAIFNRRTCIACSTLGLPTIL